MNEGVSREFLSQDRCRKSLSPTFESHAMVLIGKMREALNRLPQPPAFIQDYLQSTGLAGMFPRAAAYIANPQTLYDLGQQGSMDEHFQHMASLHLVSSMCRQLNSDVNNLANHKYIAHQVALLYSVNPLGSRGPLAPHEKAIKQNFNNIKQALTVPPDSVDPPRLPPDQAEWMNSLTGSLLTTVSGFPPELRRPMQPVLSFLQNHQ
ncbi:Hypp7369 [Branchiostoma lanceolatum]|nr:Hypp7369 [Branchiostoma lanceolatum]